jgi:hypothetical protein
METCSTLPEPFYHICIKNNHNFIIGNTIAHNMMIFVDVSEDKLPLYVQPSDTIESIKIQIKQKNKYFNRETKSKKKAVVIDSKVANIFVCILAIELNLFALK